MVKCVIDGLMESNLTLNAVYELLSKLNRTGWYLYNYEHFEITYPLIMYIFLKILFNFNYVSITTYAAKIFEG